MMIGVQKKCLKAPTTVLYVYIVSFSSPFAADDKKSGGWGGGGG